MQRPHHPAGERDHELRHGIASGIPTQCMQARKISKPTQAASRERFKQKAGDLDQEA